MEAIVAEDIDKRQRDEREKRHDFLCQWKEINGAGATYKVLINALLKIMCKQDTERVCKMLKESLIDQQQLKTSREPYVTTTQPLTSSTTSDTVSAPTLPPLTSCATVFNTASALTPSSATATTVSPLTPQPLTSCAMSTTVSPLTLQPLTSSATSNAVSALTPQPLTSSASSTALTPQPLTNEGICLGSSKLFIRPGAEGAFTHALLEKYNWGCVVLQSMVTTMCI